MQTSYPLYKCSDRVSNSQNKKNVIPKIVNVNYKVVNSQFWFPSYLHKTNKTIVDVVIMENLAPSCFCTPLYIQCNRKCLAKGGFMSERAKGFYIAKKLS